MGCSLVPAGILSLVSGWQILQGLWIQSLVSFNFAEKHAWMHFQACFVLWWYHCYCHAYVKLSHCVTVFVVFIYGTGTSQEICDLWKNCSDQSLSIEVKTKGPMSHLTLAAKRKVNPFNFAPLMILFFHLIILERSCRNHSFIKSTSPSREQ